MNVPVFLSEAAGAAAAAAFDVSELMTTSVSSIQTQLFTVLNIVVPAIVGICAAVVCVKFGLKWMKRMTA